MTGEGHRSSPAIVLAGLAVLALLGACGGGNGDSDGGSAAPAATGTRDSSTTSTPAPRGPRAAPRWEELASFDGQAPATTADFTIVPGAIQWRLRWSCEGTGTMSIAGVPALKKPLLVKSTCPKDGVAYAIQTGSRRLEVEATGAWKVAVDQQVDTPVDEPPLPEMAAAKVLSSGDFYDLEKKGKGTARLYELPGGGRALRLEGFDVTQNTDLFIWLSEAPAPRSSAEVVGKPYVQIAGLRSTVGSQNYLVPPQIPTEKIRSVVIWCEPVRIAYAAAALNDS